MATIPTFVETYRGHDIFYYAPGEFPGFQDDGWATAAIDRLFSNLPDLRRNIDVIVTPPPEPPVISSITIGAPLQISKETAFTIFGSVKNQFLVGMSGEPVQVFDNGVFIASATTNIAGTYTVNHSVSTPGVHVLSATIAELAVSRNITITDPTPPPDNGNGELPPVITFTLAIPSADNGTTNPPMGNYIHEMNTIVSVRAIPDEGVQFVRWTVNGAVNTDNPISVVMTSNVVLGATFAPGAPPPPPPGIPSNRGLIAVGALALLFLSQR